MEGLGRRKVQVSYTAYFWASLVSREPKKVTLPVPSMGQQFLLGAP